MLCELQKAKHTKPSDAELTFVANQISLEIADWCFEEITIEEGSVNGTMCNNNSNDVLSICQENNRQQEGRPK